MSLNNWIYKGQLGFAEAIQREEDYGSVTRRFSGLILSCLSFY